MRQKDDKVVGQQATHVKTEGSKYDYFREMELKGQHESRYHDGEALLSLATERKSRTSEFKL